jgi:hypothetical protein
MAIQKEIWQSHIEGNLFKNNEFLLASYDAGQYVLQGKVVHIPQAGALPNIVKNRSNLPASVSQRADTDITYSLDEFSTDPILIPQAESIELSYNKRESVLSEYEAALRQLIAESVLYDWCPTVTDNLLRTSGAVVNSHLAGTTGNRKKFVSSDLKAAQLALNKQNIPLEDRYALLSADMFQQLTDDLSATQYRDFSMTFDAKEGVLGKLFGFNIMMRSNVVSYTNDATPAAKAFGSLSAPDENDAVLCWQKNAVERALGSIHFFERTGDPTYYGDIYSIAIRMGSRKRRNDEKGILAIVQAAA